MQVQNIHYRTMGRVFRVTAMFTSDDASPAPAEPLQKRGETNMRNDFDIIDDTMAARRHYPSYDEFNLRISEQHIFALRDGKVLVTTDGVGSAKAEFAVFITHDDAESQRQTHAERHKELHAALDELFADYIWCNPRHEGSFLNMPVSKLIEWSHQQTVAPDEPQEG